MIKRRLFKRLMATALSAVMLVSLAACGAKAPEETSSETVKEESTEAESKTESEAEEAAPEKLDLLSPYEETVTLSFSRCTDGIASYPEGVTNDDNGYVNSLKEKLNIACTTAFEANMGDDYNRQVALAIASGEIPDIMVLYGDAAGTGFSFVEELYENDMIMDLTELYEEYAGEGLKEVYASYPDNSVLESAIIDDKLMALPYCAGMFYPMIWVRQDWVDALGLEVDADGNEMISREEMEMMAKAFAEADFNGKDTVGLAFPAEMTGAGIELFTDSFGAYALNYVSNEDGTVSHGSTQPEMKDALAWFAKLYEEGILDPQFGTRNEEDIKELLLNGQLGIVPDWWHTAKYSPYQLYELDNNAFLQPYNLDNGSGKVNFPATNVTGDIYVVVSKACEHPEAVFKIIELFNFYWSSLLPEEKEKEFPELFAQWDGGMSSAARPIHADFLAINSIYDQQVQPVEEYLDGTRANTDGFTNINLNILRAVEAYEIMKKEGTPMESSKWDTYHSRMKGVVHAHKLNDAGLYEMAYPIYKSTETMANNPVDLQGLMEEYFIKIITGELPIDAFDTYVEERNAQGDAAICEELAAFVK